MRRPRLTIRAMMVVVALVALLIAGGMWGVKMRRRSADYRRAAALQCARLEIESLKWLRSDEEHAARYAELAGLNGDDLWKELLRVRVDRVRVDRERAPYHAEARRRYERAARYPWWGEPELPPEPKWE